MSENNLVYNEPFEFENWVWEINGTKYFVNKYRQIDCSLDFDDPSGFYYDFIVLVFKNVNGEKLFGMRKYKDHNDMSFFCNPYKEINKDLPEMLKKLKEKYQVKSFKYFEKDKGYQELE